MANALAKFRQRRAGQAGAIAFGMSTSQGAAQALNVLTTQKGRARVNTPANGSSLAAIENYGAASRRGVKNVVRGAERNFGGALSHYINQQAAPARSVAQGTAGEAKAGVAAGGALQKAFETRLAGINAGRSAAMGSIGYERSKTLAERGKERLKLTQEQEYEWLKMQQEQANRLQYLRVQNGGSSSGGGVMGRQFSSAADDLQNLLGDGTGLKDASGNPVPFTYDSVLPLIQSTATQYNLSPEATQQLREVALERTGVGTMSADDRAQIENQAQLMAQQNQQKAIGPLGDQNILDALGIKQGKDGTVTQNGAAIPVELALQFLAYFKSIYTGHLA